LLKCAIELNPRSVDTHLELGSLYADEGNSSAAAAQYQEAIRLRPDLAAAHYRLAQIYLRSGRTREGQAELDAYNRLRRKDQNP